MNSMTTIDTMAYDIVRRHGHLALSPDALTRLPQYLQPQSGTESVVAQAVFSACQALDFIAADAHRRL
jgi:hypothetical protein